ncbi:glycerate kinase [Halobacillus mangrovi]|uniref:glycerate kinase n=1 Tax=Halobacillus mangrovi TaxID=402384 RepID=UPI003D968F65
MKIVIAPDSFKGSLSAFSVSEAMAEGVRNVDAEADVVTVPMADGGEGSIEALEKWVSKEIPVKVKGPAGDGLDTSFVILPYNGNETAFIECARSTGITLVPDEKRNPFALNSYGLGEQIRAAIENGCRDLVVSLGGSATTDGGTGLLQALGYRFYDSSGQLLPDDRNILTEIDDMDDKEVMEELAECSITIAPDVTNPFYGKNGAAYVYGPQKGASEEDVMQLDAGLERFSGVVQKATGRHLQEIQGAGAAGGLGGALAGVLGAEMKSGFDVIAELVGLETLLEDADLVLTGEGSLDAQSAHGKVPVSVGKIARNYDVPAVALAGVVDVEGSYEELTAVFSIQSGPCSLAEALDHRTTYKNIKHTTKQILSLWTK